MKLDDLYKWLGYGLVSIFLFYIIAKSLKFQAGVVEGLVNLATSKPSNTNEPSNTSEPSNKENEENEENKDDTD